MRKLNSTAKLAFYNARYREGDIERIADKTGYSISHISNVRNGNRRISREIGNAMYNIARNRKRNSEMINR